MHKWSIKGALCAAVIICFHSGSVRWQFSRWHFQPLGAGTKPQRSTNTGTKQQASLLTRSSRATNKPAPFHLRQTSKSRRTFRLTSFTPLCVALAALRMAYLLPRPKYKHRQILCMQCWNVYMVSIDDHTVWLAQLFFFIFDCSFFKDSIKKEV